MRVKASEAYKRGNFNNCNIIMQDDGSVKITIHKIGWKKVYSFVVVNKGKENERILEDEVIEE